MKKYTLALLLFFTQSLLLCDNAVILDPIEYSEENLEDNTTTRATQASKLQYFVGDVIIQDTLKVTNLYAQYANIEGGIAGDKWPLLSVPWTNWQYFVGVLSGTTASLLWVPSDMNNGTGYEGSPNRNFGSVNIDIETAGTYAFSFAYQMQNNTGIATFVIDGVTTTVDTYYPFSTMASHTWTQVLGVGTYTLTLSSLTKNVASSDYWLQFLGDGLSIRRVA